MKVRIRLRAARKKTKKGNAFNRTFLCVVCLAILSLSNVFILDNISTGWSRSLASYFTKSFVTACPHNMTVDILSVSPIGMFVLTKNFIRCWILFIPPKIGSAHRLDYLAAQQNTFASHCTVRNFFSATEKDDADPECESKLTNQTVVAISNFCRRGQRWGRHGKWFMEYMTGAYAFHRWLMKKKNPQGWVCAQTRPAQALHNVVEKYKKRNESFPDCK